MTIRTARTGSRAVPSPTRRGGRWTLLGAVLLGVGLVMPACEQDAAQPTAPAPAPPPVPPPPAPGPPGVPSGLRVSVTGPGFIEWSWEAVAGAEGYQVQFSGDFLFTADDEVVDRTGEETSYRRENLPAGATAYLRVRASSGMGEDQLFSDWSGSVSGQSPIPVPSGLRVSASGGDFIEWSWEAAEDAAGYQAQYSTDATFTAEDELIDRTAGQISYRKENLAYRTPGHLRVRTLVQVGFERLAGDWSPQVAGLTDPPGPGLEWQLVREGGGLLSPRGTKGATLYGIAADESGRFVAAGADGTISRSDDGGVRWTEASQTATDGAVLDVAWGGGRFVAVGRANDGSVLIVHSDDGDRWEAASEPTIERGLGDVAWGDGRFVAVSDDGAIVHSSDGDRWETATDPATESGLYDVAWSRGRYVAVGAGGVVVYSDDGDRWETASEPPTGVWSLNGAVGGGGRFVAVGSGPRGAVVVHSADGDRWAPASEPAASAGLTAVVWNGRRFVAVGLRGAIVSSTDGDRWVEEAAATSTISLHRVASSGERFVAVGGGPGGNGTILHGQGGTWAPADVPESLPVLIGAASANGRLVAVGDAGTILHSDDRDLWDEASGNPTSARLWGIAHNGDRFVAVGFSPPTFLYSNDGDVWQEATETPDGLILLDVVWTGTRFLAVGFRALVHSVDGVRWEAASEAPWQTLMHGVAAIGSRLVAVGSEGAAFLSDDDGATWTTASETGTVAPLRAVASDGHRLVAVGGDGTIIHSDDGTRWRAASETATGEYLRAVAWNGERFLAVGGYGAVVHSEDGDRWEAASESATPEILVGIHWTGTHFVAVGYNGTIVVSPITEEE